METDLKRIYRLATRRQRDNRNFLRWLKYRQPWPRTKLLRLQRQLVRRVWQEVECTECANCCSQMQLQLTARDCAQVARAAGMELADFQRQHTDRHRDGLWYLKKQPCLFLDGRRCTIYEARPSRCRGFPYLDTPMIDDVAGTLDKVLYCPVAFNVLEAIKAHPELQRRTPRRKR
ncbi:MAG: YkgJ family cysteine cluster protein [Candidatus Zipacnadales bacterium]